MRKIYGEQITGSVSQSISASYAVTASYATNAGGIDTGSLVGTGSYNIFTGSYYQDSASFDTRINTIDPDPFPYTGSALVSGSMTVTGSTYISGALYANALYVSASSLELGFDSLALDGNLIITGSSLLNDITGSSFTGSFVGDGSGITGIVSASHALNSDSAISSSYATTSSYSNTSTSASYASTSTSASYAATASYALGGSGSFAGNFSGSLEATSFDMQLVEGTGSMNVSSSLLEIGFDLLEIDGGLDLTGSMKVTGSIESIGNVSVLGSVAATSFTGSMQGYRDIVYETGSFTLSSKHTGKFVILSGSDSIIITVADSSTGSFAINGLPHEADFFWSHTSGSSSVTFTTGSNAQEILSKGSAVSMSAVSTGASIKYIPGLGWPLVGDLS